MDAQSEWFPVVGELLAQFINGGTKVALRANRTSTVAPVFKEYLVTGYRATEWEVIIGQPLFVPTPRKKTVYFTRWDDGVTDPWKVELLGRANVKIVPSRWDAQMFRDAGVEGEIHVIPLGCNPTLVGKESRSRNDTFLFGAAPSDEVIALFREAFPHNRDAMLHLMPVDLWRMPYFLSIHAFIDISDDTLGLLAIDAMACGAPVIASAVGTRTQFLTNETGYPVRPTKEGKCDRFDLINQMRRVYLDRQEALELGRNAARSVRTWRETYEDIRAILVAHGVI